jgi:hypothetical protein
VFVKRRRMELPLTPRVNASLLPGLVGQTVRLVSKHQGYSGPVTMVTASDGQQVKVFNADADAFEQSHFVEVLGKVNPDFSINAFAVTSFGNSFGKAFGVWKAGIFECFFVLVIDLKLYDQLVKLENHAELQSSLFAA